MVGFTVGAAAAVAGAGAYYYGTRIGVRNLELSRKVVMLPRLPAAAEGLRVLHISDLHFHLGDRRPPEFFHIIQDLVADVILLTGDYIDEDAMIPEAAAFVEKLDAPLGKYAVMGNHDHCLFGLWTAAMVVAGSRVHVPTINDIAGLTAAFREAGCPVLQNENLTLDVGGAPLHLVGVDDPLTLHHDLEAAYADVPEDDCAILLAHTPDILADLQGRRPDLILSGHTHGGQVKLPLMGEIITNSELARGCASGLFRRGETQIHISRGLGSSHPIRMRLNCQPEVTLLELRRGPIDTPELRVRNKSFYRKFRQAALRRRPVP